jgi:hypothetical protein
VARSAAGSLENTFIARNLRIAWKQSADWKPTKEGTDGRFFQTVLITAGDLSCANLLDVTRSAALSVALAPCMRSATAIFCSRDLHPSSTPLKSALSFVTQPRSRRVYSNSVPPPCGSPRGWRATGGGGGRPATGRASRCSAGTEDIIAESDRVLDSTPCRSTEAEAGLVTSGRPEAEIVEGGLPADGETASREPQKGNLPSPCHTEIVSTSSKARKSAMAALCTR